MQGSVYIQILEFFFFFLKYWRLEFWLVVITGHVRLCLKREVVIALVLATIFSSLPIVAGHNCMFSSRVRWGRTASSEI